MVLCTMDLRCDTAARRHPPGATGQRPTSPRRALLQGRRGRRNVHFVVTRSNSFTQRCALQAGRCPKLTSDASYKTDDRGRTLCH